MGAFAVVLKASAAGAAAILALSLGACDGTGSGSAAAGTDGEAEPVGDLRAGSVAQLADCSDWRRGSRAERLATIAEVRSQINLQDGSVRTPELSDETAYEFFENTCANDFARSFRLYKVYARAAAFQSFAE